MVVKMFYYFKNTVNGWVCQTSEAWLIWCIVSDGCRRLVGLMDVRRLFSFLMWFGWLVCFWAAGSCICWVVCLGDSGEKIRGDIEQDNKAKSVRLNDN